MEALVASVTFPDPGSAYVSFMAATTARDVELAMASATTESWRRHGESAAKVFHTAAGEGFEFVEPQTPYVVGDRAVIESKVQRVGEPWRSVAMYFMLECIDGSWGVSAAVREEKHAALFMKGLVPAVFEIEDLGPSPHAEGWARMAKAMLTDDVLLTVGEIEDATRAPVLGVLPIWRENGATAFAALDGDDPTVLAYGDLVLRMLDNDAGRLMAFSSATLREGAGSVVGNLAVLFAQLNEQVLVIDLNVALPSLHIAFGSLNPAPGLTEVLMKGRSWDMSTRVFHPNLDVMTAGTQGPLSNEALNTFVDFLQDATQRYHRIMVVVPPVGLSMMAQKLGMDPILVVHAGAVPQAVVSQLAQKVSAAGTPLKGVIATRLLPESVPDSRVEEGIEALRRHAEGEVRRIEVLGTMQLPTVGRALAGISRHVEGMDFPLREWTCFDTTGGRLRGIAQGSEPTLDLLLTDVTATLPRPGGPDA